jgi:integrase
LYQLNGNDVTRGWLKAVINKFYNKKEPGAETLIQYIRRFIVEATNGTRLISGKRYTASTIKNYVGFEVQLLEYCGIYAEKTKLEIIAKGKSLRPVKVLNFDDITIDFYKDFLIFFNKKNYSPNTIGRHIKHLKVIMRQSYDEGLHNNTEFQRKSFESMTVKVQNVYLNEAELKKILELDLSERKNFEIARDVFLCGCYTAQRYSDYCRISNDHIKEYSGRRVIEIIQQKTGEKCIIPIRPELNLILQKYDYSLPRTYEQKVNKYIKDIVKLAGITENINNEENKGGLKVKTSIPKNELIKTHSARRSGCTNMYLAGIPTIDIMKISGHKTEREFLKYINVSKEETAIILSNHPFFIGNTLSIAK